MKYTVMVINNIFEDDNLLIIKSKGEQIIERFVEPIEKEDVDNKLAKMNVDKKDYKIFYVGRSWGYEKAIIEEI